MQTAYLFDPGSEAMNAIDSLQDLTPGWDSCDAEAPAQRTQVQAKSFLSYVERMLGPAYASPIVSPTPDGGVALLWRRPNQPKVQVLFSPSGARYLVYAGRDVLQRGVVNHYDVLAFEVIKRHVSL